MDTKKIIECIEVLSEKATNTLKSEDALRFSQAACNLANAVTCVHLNLPKKPLLG